MYAAEWLTSSVKCLQSRVCKECIRYAQATSTRRRHLPARMRCSTRGECTWIHNASVSHLSSRKTEPPFSLFQAAHNTMEQSHMNLLCLIGLLARVWLFNQAVTREELLLDTPAESRDFIDSHTGLPFYLWLSGFRESKKVTLLHWKQQQAVQPRLKPSVSLKEGWRYFPKYHSSIQPLSPQDHPLPTLSTGPIPSIVRLLEESAKSQQRV